jgi:hypothetical protein
MDHSLGFFLRQDQQLLLFFIANIRSPWLFPDSESKEVVVLVFGTRSCWASYFEGEVDKVFLAQSLIGKTLGNSIFS